MLGNYQVAAEISLVVLSSTELVMVFSISYSVMGAR
jgi:hypothetical protein